MGIFARIRKLEGQVDALISCNQERNCMEGKHKPGVIVKPFYSYEAPWIKCPACYANLSNPKPPVKE